MRKDISIYIPSYKRAGMVTTLKDIGVIDDRFALVVRPIEYNDYLEKHPFIKIIILPDSVSNLSQTRQHIVDICPTRYCMMLDDDLRFYYRPNREDWHLKYVKPGMFNIMIEEMLSVMEDNEVVHCAISAREGNNREKYSWCCNKRYMRAYIFDLQTVRQFKYKDDCVGCEDFEMALQLLTHGYKNMITYAWSQGQKSSHAPGGLNACGNINYRDHSARVLQRLYPQYVKLKPVNHKTAWLKEEHLQIFVKWSLAYKESPNKYIGAICPPANILHAE